MQDFLTYLETLPVWGRLLWVVFVLAVFWILEGYYAFVKRPYKKWKHAGVNAVFLLFTVLINIGFGVLTAIVFEATESHGFGLLYLVALPTGVGLLLSLLLLDFIAQYGVHYLLHKVPWMWRLHLVHHSDTTVDVTTGTRHHPLDFIIRESFALLTVLLVGMPVAFYLTYRLCSVLFTYFTHANIRLGRFDKWLSYIFVTPKMHKFHHHYKMPWTDTNYGNMFSFWDRLFGTFVYEDENAIRYGLDIIDDTTDQDIVYQLQLPFDRRVKTGKLPT